MHTSEHSVNIRTNSAFGKIRPSDNFPFRTYAILHCLNHIRNFYNFMVKTCFHHNICRHPIHKKFFKISFLALSGLQYLQEWSTPAAWSEDELPRVQDIDLSSWIVKEMDGKVISS